MEKDTIILNDETKDMIRSVVFADRLTSLIKTITQKGGLRTMIRARALALTELKGRGLLESKAFAESYIAVLEKRSDLPRSRRDVIEMLGNTVLDSIAPGGKWEEQKG